MNLNTTLEAYGTSEGLGKAWDTRGRGRHAQLSDRAKRALETYVPVNSAKIQLALESQTLIASAIGGTVTRDNAPFDVVKGKNAIEVKTIFPGVKNNKITMHPESRVRKEKFARKEKMKPYTVIVDRRDNSVHVAEGVKSFRLGKGNVKQVSLSELRETFK